MSARVRILLLTALFIFTLFLVACDPSPERDIIGSWDVVQGMDESATAEFNEDGSGTLGSSDSSIPISYSIVGDGLMSVVFVELPGENTFSWEFEMISRDEIHIVTDQGLILDLVRQSE